ncbi:S41 family peptidase [Flavipsychrobacter stenotrophus]|uniref:S41 family peptidase n=1 Tax=Flavipsychrobacter stenotrophus TaxID=2077091 RepID=UPI001374DACF|nr:S41 family peptidase [Flavipsychrobacter stenotrophus]
MKQLFTLLLFIVGSATQAQQQFTSAQYKEDFNYFWKSIDEDYCYFNKKQTDWAKVKEIYSPRVDTVSSRASFVSLLEDVFTEIYDHHAGLNTNNMNSARLVPSGSEVWAEYIDGKPIITEVRQDFASEHAYVTAGMEVIAINGIPVEKAIQRYVGKSLKTVDAAARNYALNVAMAGTHDQDLKFTLKDQSGKIKEYTPDVWTGHGQWNGLTGEHYTYGSMVEGKIMGNIGYVKLNNCLGDNDMIPVLDSVMQTMLGTSGLVLDLRETPSGGNTTVARAILGWFTNKEQFYQKHELYAEGKQTGIQRSWVEIVSPRPGKYYNKPLVVLADHFTGSIAEGITIGFSATTKAKIIGTPLARLCGATYPYELPNTHIHYSFPAERLYHVNGTPREQFVPDIVIDYTKTPVTGRDVALDRAMAVLQGKAK